MDVPKGTLVRQLRGLEREESRTNDTSMSRDREPKRNVSEKNNCIQLDVCLNWQP